MSITVSTALNTVLNGVVQEVGVRVTLDLDIPDIDFSTVFTDPVRSINLSAQNGTDLPDEVRDVVGFTATGGELVLSGPIAPLRKESMAWLLNPDETASPFYRRSIKGVTAAVDLGYRVPGTVGMEWVRKLTGSVAALSSVEHDSGTVTLALVDRSVDYDNTPDIPGVAVANPYNAGLTSAFCMDAIIRSNGRPSTWPATRPGALLAAGLVSSLWPEVGTLYTLFTQPAPKFAAGAYGPGLCNYDLNTGPFGQVMWTLPGGTSSIYAEALVSGADLDSGGFSVGSLRTSSGSPGTILLRGLSVQIDAAGVRFYVDSTLTVTIAATMTPGPHLVAFQANYSGSPTSGTFTGTVWLDGTSQTFTQSTTDTEKIHYANPANAVIAGIGLGDPGLLVMNGFQVTAETTPTPSWTFTPTAVLDVSLNPLTVVPEIPAGSKGSDELQTIAAAELGYARFDEQGVFRFTNRDTIAAADITRTLTAETGLRTGLTTSVGASTQYDHVQVPFTAWAQAAPTALFTLADVKRIPGRQTTSWTQALIGIAVNVQTTVTLLPDGHDPADGGSYYRASLDPNGLAAHPGLTITATVVSSGTVRIQVVNPYSSTAYLTTPASYTDFAAGSAASGLWIGGTPINPADEALTDSMYGTGSRSTLVVASNAYLQVQDAAQAVGDYLLPQLVVAIRDFTNVAIIPDPRVQITDKVHLVEPYRSHVDEYAYVWGFGFSAEFPAPGESGGSWDMSLDLRALGPPGAWLLGIPGRSELGDGTLANPGTAYLYAS